MPEESKLGMRRVFMELILGKDPLTFFQYEAQQDEQALRRFTREAFMQDAKIFASSREEAFHARVDAVTPLPLPFKSFPLAARLPLVFHH